MFHLRSLILSALFLIGLLFASVQGLEGKEQTDIKAKTRQNCLWQVSHKDKIMYIQGSIHLLRAQDYPLNSSIINAYEQADSLVLEVDMNEITKPAFMMSMIQEASLKDSSLETVLDEETYQYAKEKMASLGMKMKYYNRLKPWYMCTTVLVSRLSQLGFNATLGLDQHFFKKAKKDSKEIIGLEEASEQMTIMSKASGLDPNRYVRMSFEDIDNIEEQMDSLVQSWREGNLAGLEPLLASLDDYPEIYNIILKERNHKWIPQLKKCLLSDKTHFVVVGALHMVGPDSILKLLEKEGYTLKQL
ncbi:MAG: TraB/GumN family protein [Planctomycetes bacterium]|nr:TraB/GumN family protein [Planctomycetota bacterium]